MVDTGSFSFDTYTGTEYGVSLSDGDSSSSTTIGVEVETSSPDDSDGSMAGILAAEGLAVGEDTLTIAEGSAEIIDDGNVTSADLSATVVAAAESSSEDPPFASAFTSAEIDGGAEIVITQTYEAESTQQSDSETTTTAVSSVDVTAYDIHLSGSEDPAPSTEVDGGEDPESAGDEEVDLTEIPAESPVEGEIDEPPLILEDPSLGDFDVDYLELDGNVALVEVEALAVGDDTLVSVDAAALAVEDSLSVSTFFVVVGVD